MTTIIAKIFIIMTMVFEAITITTGPALYPVFAAACVIILACLTLQFIIGKIQKICIQNKSARRIFLLG